MVIIFDFLVLKWVWNFIGVLMFGCVVSVILKWLRGWCCFFFIWFILEDFFVDVLVDFDLWYWEFICRDEYCWMFYCDYFGCWLYDFIVVFWGWNYLVVFRNIFLRCILLLLLLFCWCSWFSRICCFFVVFCKLVFFIGLKFWIRLGIWVNLISRLYFLFGRWLRIFVRFCWYWRINVCLVCCFVVWLNGFSWLLCNFLNFDNILKRENIYGLNGIFCGWFVLGFFWWVRKGGVKCIFSFFGFLNCWVIFWWNVGLE